MKVYKKMEKTVTKFGGTETEKYKLYQYKSHVLMENIGINKIVAYNKVSFSKILSTLLGRNMLK